MCSNQDKQSPARFPGKVLTDNPSYDDLEKCYVAVIAMC